MNITRRRFLKASAISAAPLILSADSPSKKYRTALLGSGWWGMNILGEAISAGESEIVALCDADQNQLGPAADKVEKLTGHGPRQYQDYRELLEKEKPEIAIVASPDHWHPLMTIDAVRAGAHVYVEKPISHTINEGRAMVRAAREAGRVVQVGTHRRVSPHNRSGMEFLKSGKAGKIGMVRAFVHYGGGPESVEPNRDLPKGLDWDMWCGPAPLRPFNRKIHPRGFRGFLDYANGTLGDWGIHWMDQILWWTEEKSPRKVSSFGARHIKGAPVNGPEGQTSDAPDTQLATFEFETFTACWEHRQYAGNEAEKANLGCYFYGTEGTFHMGWLDGWTFYPTSKGKPSIHADPQLHEPDQQNIRQLWADFLDAIKRGRRPVCDIEIGHRSTNMSLLAMISMKTGRTVRWDGEKGAIVGDPEANALQSRMYRGEWKYPAV